MFNLSNNELKQISRYFEVKKQFPEQFKQSELLQIIPDKEKMIEFFKNTGKAIGVVYESPYHIIVVDLMKNKAGQYFSYLRILNPTGNGNGVVMIPLCNEKIVLLHQFRHGARDWQWELPRGFSEPNQTSKETAKQEMREELDAEVLSIEYEGTIISDSSLSGGLVDIFSVTIESVNTLETEEGISSYRWVSFAEINKMIKANEITDAYTICAIAKYILNREDE